MEKEIIKTVKMELNQVEALAVKAMVADGVSQRKRDGEVDWKTDRFINIGNEFIGCLEEFVAFGHKK
jgi:hypothetical protein